MPTPPEMMETVLRYIADQAGGRQEPVELDRVRHNHVSGSDVPGDLTFTLQGLIDRKLIERGGRMDIPQFRLTMAGYEHLAQINASKPPAPEGPDPAFVDALTGLSNRRAFDRDLPEVVGAASADAPLSFVMVDVDHFKKVNDNHGHPAGDAALKEIAARLMSVVSGKGKAYRYGGEEMALLLPNHTPDEGVTVAERARLAIEGAIVPGQDFKLTASLGLATFPEHAEDSEALIKAADGALYQAKRTGRNHVRLHGEPDNPPETATATKAPKRRAPEPGGLSEEDAERIRLEYFRSRIARCPKDSALLTVEQAGFGQVGGLTIYCPMCGLVADIEGAP